MIFELVLNGLLHSLGQQKRQDLQYGVGNVLFQSEQVVEVNGAILRVQSLSNFINEFFREANVIEIVEERRDNDPEKVDDHIV